MGIYFLPEFMSRVFSDARVVARRDTVSCKDKEFTDARIFGKNHCVGVTIQARIIKGT
jgi:hypothetical protein